MLKRYLLLINIFILSNVYSQTIVNFTGYVTSTQFSDTQWQMPYSKVAVNIDANIDDWGLKTQIINDGESKISRLTLERYFSIAKNREMVVKIGMFPRLDYLHNGTVDSASNSMMAMLPLGQYNYRLLDSSTYTTLQGVSLSAIMSEQDYYTRVHIDYGKSVIDNNCHIHKEITRQPCMGDVRYESKPANYSIGTRTEVGKWTFLLFKNRINVKADENFSKDPRIRFINSVLNEAYLSSLGLGVSYKDKKWWAQAELKNNKYCLLPISQIASTNNGVHVDTNSHYVLFGYFINDDLSVHASVSKGGDSIGTSAVDNVIGMSYTHKKMSLSAEYHKGRGKEWMRYDTPIAKDNWESLVATFTYRF